MADETERRGERGRKMVFAPSRGGGVSVTDWTVAELLEELAERELDPADVTIEYRGCGSHVVEINWTDGEDVDQEDEEPVQWK